MKINSSRFLQQSYADCTRQVKESADVRKITPALAGEEVTIRYKDNSENDAEKELTTTLLTDEQISRQADLKLSHAKLRAKRSKIVLQNRAT